MIVEGAYPYVAGGVSSWIHDLITHLSEFNFSLAVLLSKKDQRGEIKYDLPSNITEIKEIFLHDGDLPSGSAGRLPRTAWHDVANFHDHSFGIEKLKSFESIYRRFFQPDSRGLAPDQIYSAKEAWDILRDLYEARAGNESFIDYFWNFRFIHQSIFKVMSADPPDAAVYHALSTGYAGLLGVIAKLKHDRPLLLTEHGIYSRERKLEIGRADWIYEASPDGINIRQAQSHFKNLWSNMFSTLGRVCYDYADLIITLSRGNQLLQIEDGADPNKMMVIPNGVDVDAFSKIQKQPQNDGELTLGFMGRVVDIKDVKTFIRACRLVADEVGGLQVMIMGPTDEDESYFEGCVKLTEQLGLQKTIHFTGEVDARSHYPQIDILVLTSLNEAQPLVILEANAMGIPVVATDVGACREMLCGSTPGDQLLGKSGLVAGVAQAKDIATAILTIWKSAELRQEMANAGRKRAARYYNRHALDDQYRDIYQQYILKSC